MAHFCAVEGALLMDSLPIAYGHFKHRINGVLWQLRESTVDAVECAVAVKEELGPSAAHPAAP